MKGIVTGHCGPFIGFYLSLTTGYSSRYRDLVCLAHAKALGFLMVRERSLFRRLGVLYFIPYHPGVPDRCIGANSGLSQWCTAKDSMRGFMSIC